MDQNTTSAENPAASDDNTGRRKLRRIRSGRAPLQDISNAATNTVDAPQGSGMVPENTLQQVTQEGEEIVVGASTSVPLQVSISTADPTQGPPPFLLTTMISASEAQSNESSFALPAALCFLPLPTFMARGSNVNTLGHLTYQQMVSEEIAFSPRWVANYAEELHACLREQEVQFRPNPTYLDGSAWVTEQQRSGLVDAVLSFGQRYNLALTTLQLACSLVDRYLSVLHCPPVAIHRSAKYRRNFEPLPLMGVELDLLAPCGLLTIAAAAIWMAYKLEERQVGFDFHWLYTLALSGNWHSAAGAPLKANIVACEARIVNALNYNLIAPTAHSFLCRLIPIADFSHHDDGMLARCICERTLLEYAMLQFLPSLLAASAVYLTRYLGQHHAANLNKEVQPAAGAKNKKWGAGNQYWGLADEDRERVWTAKLERFSGYSEKDLQPCVLAQLHMFAHESHRHARLYAHNLLEGSDYTYDNLLRALLQLSQNNASHHDAAGHFSFVNPAGRIPRALALYQYYLPGILEHLQKSLLRDADQHAVAVNAVQGIVAPVLTQEDAGDTDCEDELNVTQDTMLEGPWTPYTQGYQAATPATVAYSHSRTSFSCGSALASSSASSSFVPIAPVLRHPPIAVTEPRFGFEPARFSVFGQLGQAATSSNAGPSTAAPVSTQDSCDQMIETSFDIFHATLMGDASNQQGSSAAVRSVLTLSQEESNLAYPMVRNGNEDTIRDPPTATKRVSFTAGKGSESAAGLSNMDEPVTATTDTTATAAFRVPHSLHGATSCASAANLPELCATAPKAAKDADHTETMVLTQEGYAYQPTEAVGATEDLNRAAKALTIMAAPTSDLPFLDPTSGPKKGKGLKRKLSYGPGTKEEEPPMNHVQVQEQTPLVQAANMFSTPPARRPVSKAARPRTPRLLQPVASVVEVPLQLQDKFQLYPAGPVAVPSSTNFLLNFDEHDLAYTSIPRSPRMHNLQNLQNLQSHHGLQGVARAVTQESGPSSRSSLHRTAQPLPLPLVQPSHVPLQPVIDAAIARVDRMDPLYDSVYQRYFPVYRKLVVVPPLL